MYIYHFTHNLLKYLLLISALNLPFPVCYLPIFINIELQIDSLFLTIILLLFQNFKLMSNYFFLNYQFPIQRRQWRFRLISYGLLQILVVLLSFEIGDLVPTKSFRQQQQILLYFAWNFNDLNCFQMNIS